MLHKLGALILVALVIWVLVDPVSAGTFVRHAMESVATALRSLGQES